MSIAAIICISLCSSLVWGTTLGPINGFPVLFLCCSMLGRPNGFARGCSTNTVVINYFAIGFHPKRSGTIKMVKDSTIRQKTDFGAYFAYLYLHLQMCQYFCNVFFCIIVPDFFFIVY